MQFQVPQSQQKPSDHDRLMTSNPNRHNFQTISKSCTANFRIMPEVKKRYIIRAHTQGSGSVGNQQKRPDDHGKRPERNSFQKSATIHIFCGRGFANRHFTEIHRLYAPLSRLSRPLPEYLFTEATGNLPTFSNIFPTLPTHWTHWTHWSQRKDATIGRKCNFRKKIQLTQKNRRFTTLNADFTTFSNLTPP